MSAIEALYYPAWDPPPKWLRANLLFFDKVSVIVPEDAKPKYCPQNLGIMKELPNTFGELREKSFDPALDDSQLRNLAAALDEIARTSPIVRHESHEPQEASAIHRAKITNRISGLLKDRDLIHDEYDDFVHTDPRVAHLLLSLIADRYSKKGGEWTVTDDPLSYAVNAIGLIDTRQSPSPESHLATAILTTVFPDTIEYLTPKEFAKVRARYEPLRQILPTVIRDIAYSARLEQIANQEDLKARVEKCSAQFVKEVKLLKTSKLGLSNPNWVPLGIGTLIDATAQSYGTIALTLGAAWQVVSLAQEPTTETPEVRAKRLISELRYDTYYYELIKRMNESRAKQQRNR